MRRPRPGCLLKQQAAKKKDSRPNTIGRARGVMRLLGEKKKWEERGQGEDAVLLQYPLGER